MKALILAFLSALSVTSVLAKRSAPVEVPPVVVGDVMVSVPHFTEIDGAAVKGGVLEARDSRTKKLLWNVRVYQTNHDPGLEEDVQDVFIKTLVHDAAHGLLVLSDEMDRVFVVDLKSRAVTPVSRSGAPETGAEGIEVEASKEMKAGDLCQHWIHSREEQKDPNAIEQIFRPAGSRPFPPSRFRMAYQFSKNGDCQWMDLDPADAHHFKPGTWELDPAEKSLLKITKDGETESFRIVELTKEILRLAPAKPMP